MQVGATYLTLLCRLAAWGLHAAAAQLDTPSTHPNTLIWVSNPFVVDLVIAVFVLISLFHNRLFFNASNIRKLSNLANLAQKQIGCQHVLLSHQHEQALPVTGDGTHCSGREDTGWVDSVNAQNRVNICLKNINTWYDQEKKENGGSFSLNFWSELGLLCRPLWQSATCKF